MADRLWDRVVAMRGSRSLTRIVRVVPNVPTFAVDGGFRYAVPDDLDGITLGSMVRVPLAGRRTRGFVVEESRR